MDCVEALEEYAVEHDIYIHPHAVAGSLAIAFSARDESAVAIDYAKIETRAEQAVILVHEMGHIEADALNSARSPYDTEGRNERRAWKWAIRELLPVERLTEAVRSAQGRLWEVAEDLGVTQEFVERAIEYYRTQA